MSFNIFLVLLSVFAALTGLCVEGVKKILDEKEAKYSVNLLACIVGCIVGICGTIVYYIVNYINFNLVNIVYMIVMGIATSIGSMVGYDKLIQTLTQFKTKEDDNIEV